MTPEAARSLHLLVVEDNTINQSVARRVLTSAGHVVDIVADGPSAIEAVQARHYDGILMDIQMPGMDGMETTRRIRALPPDIAAVPIIAVTGNSGADEEYLAAGMDGSIVKPYEAAALRAIVDRLGTMAAGRKLGSIGFSATGLAPVFDPRRLDELKEMTDKDSFADLVGEFAQALETRLARLTGLVEQANWPEAAREAHDIGSAAGAAGVARLSSRARHIQAVFQAGEPALCRSSFRVLAEDAGEALRALKNYQAAA